MKRWRCKGCGAIRQGEKAPEACPICGGSNFVEVNETAGCCGTCKCSTK